MDKRDYKNMWVHAEVNNGVVHPVTLELCCEARKLCDQSGDKLIAVIPGKVLTSRQNILPSASIITSALA
mgnify:CR=1 FL=1